MERFSILTKSWCSVALVAALGACSGTATVRPSSANGPAAQLAKGDGYRKVYPAFVTQSVIAASNFAESGNAKLEYLVKSAEPVTLSLHAEPMGVLVAPEAPASALFIDEPSREAVGTLKFVDLTTKPVSVRPIKDGVLVPVEGIYYGADGHQVLFVSNYDMVQRLGKLQWSDGTTTKPVGDAASPVAVVFNAAHTLAVVALGVDSTTRIGRLVAVDMKTGAGTALASSVAVTGFESDLAFSLSADGSAVAYTTSDGKLLRISTKGGDPVTVSPKGHAPAISADGQTVVFYAEDKLFSWTNGSPTLLAETPDSVRPRFSPDQNWVVFFRKMVFGGQGAAAAVGDAMLVPAAGNASAVKLASNVGWDAVFFNPKSSRVAVVGDLTTLDQRPSYEGVGNLYVGLPGQASNVLKRQTKPGNVALLEQSDTLAYIAGMEPGSPVGVVYVGNGPGEPLKLSITAVPGTLRTPKGFDSMVFLADPKDELLDGVYRIGALYGSTPKGPAKVLPHAEEGVIQAVYGRDGRVVVVVAENSNADLTGIWTLPTP